MSGETGWLCDSNVKSRMFVWGLLWQVFSQPTQDCYSMTPITSQLSAYRFSWWCGLQELCGKCLGLSEHHSMQDGCALLLCQTSPFISQRSEVGVLLPVFAFVKPWAQAGQVTYQRTLLRNRVLSPDFSALSQVLLSLKSWEQISCYSGIFCISTHLEFLARKNTGVLTY